MIPKKPYVIGLFSGCGGLALGAELAGFHSLAAVDIDKDLQSSYRLNFPLSKVINHDLTLFTPSMWSEILNGKKVDGVIGGPPCQGFSRIGLRNIDDPRNNLLAQYFMQISILKPKFFLMENVEGLLDAKNKEVLYKALDLIPRNYQVIGPFKINALSCGATTSRKRVVVIGFDPNYMDAISEYEIASSHTKPPITVREAISDIPSPSENDLKSPKVFNWMRYKPTSLELSDYAFKMRKMPSKGLGAKISLERLIHGEVSGVINTKHSQPVIERFSKTRPGETESVSRYPRLSWDGHCPTLRAGTGSDKGSFQSMRPIHPSEPRVITVREAARLQGFPDWFIFHPTIWHSFRMIGNSVSPLMSHHIMDMISKKIENRVTA
ncbi:DNA cytosine methyltransferase [Vreelandella alkaliphila]|uniref:DNA cytosine methyltransferase n=1 Tax=Vreelandella alkaliphila TaxID=272774 RepID=UPI003FD74EE4